MGDPWRGPTIGLCVGLTDVVFVFPLAVLATRRENGQTLRGAIARGRLHAGAATAATLLLPYSILVESLSAAARDALRARDADAAARGRAELEAFYDAHAPDKRDNVGALLAQAGGDLEGLVRQVYLKYAAFLT